MDGIATSLRTVQEDVARYLEDGDRSSHARMLGNITRLRIAAEGPATYAATLRFHFVEAACIFYAIESGVLDAVVAKNGDIITANEIAKATSENPLLIVRTMRVLNALKISDEIQAESYASNAVAEALVTPEQKAGIKWSAELLWPVAGNFAAYMRQSGLHQFPERSRQKGAFEFNFGQPIFEFLECHEREKRNFDHYFQIRNYGRTEPWFDIYPIRPKIEALKEVLLVDVGGGRGQDLVRLAEHVPEARSAGLLILQDLPSTIEKLAALPHGIKTMPYDFFTPQPVQGAAYYFMHHICHDWSNENAQKILSNTAKAMSKESRLLLHEFVVPDHNASLRGALFDTVMLLLFCGLERTYDQWDELLTSAGLQIEQVWHPKGNGEAVVEARLKS